jgi:hypothetical protein
MAAMFLLAGESSAGAALFLRSRWNREKGKERWGWRGGDTKARLCAIERG